MLTYEQCLEINRLASVLGTARVIKYRGGEGLIKTVTKEQAQARMYRAQYDLLKYLESLRDPQERLHPDNVSAADTWQFYLATAKEEAKCE